MARAYHYITSRTSPNQNARNSKITGITIHWWGNPTGQNIEGIVSWLCDKRAGTSAHYVVSEDTVYCIVDPDRRAWHAGNSRANHTQIGIELDPNASRRASTEKTAAALISDLRSVYGNLPLSPHKRWTSTQCPGDWDLGRLDKLARGVKPGIPTGGASAGGSRPTQPWESSPRVQGMSAGEVRKVQQALADRGYDLGKWGVDGKYGEATYNAVKAAQKALGVAVDGIAGPDTMNALTGAPKPSRKVEVDGRYGGETHSEVQRRRGRPVDGRLGAGDLADLCQFFGLPKYDEISDQPRRHDEIGNAIVPGIWDHDPDHKGPNSVFVRTWEAYAGATVDRGSWGPELSRRIQIMLNEHDGFMRDRDAVQVERRAKRAGVR